MRVVRNNWTRWHFRDHDSGIHEIWTQDFVWIITHVRKARHLQKVISFIIYSNDRNYFSTCWYSLFYKFCSIFKHSKLQVNVFKTWSWSSPDVKRPVNWFYSESNYFSIQTTIGNRCSPLSVVWFIHKMSSCDFSFWTTQTKETCIISTRNKHTIVVICAVLQQVFSKNVS